ncbi:MAG: NF038122 family metalloprotease [Planctomycetota bacterium]|jgi:hypothetical protein|nr:NF038122 family metalloprotease [Planctomycetota bacterium]
MFLSLSLLAPILGAPPQEPGGAEFVFLDKHRKPFRHSPEVDKAFALAAEEWQGVLLDDVTIYVLTTFQELDSEKGLGGWKREFMEYPAEDIYEALRGDSSSPNDRRALRVMPIPGEAQVVAGRDGNSRRVFSLNAWTTSRSGEYRQRRINTLSVTPAQAKALYMVPHDEAGFDITINMNSDIHWDMDPSDGIESGHFDLVGTIAHELGHGLGFFSGLDSPMYLMQPDRVFSILDLYRFNNAGAESDRKLRWDLGRGGNPVLALEDGRVPLGTLSDGIEYEAGHWQDEESAGSYLGLMSPEPSRGIAASFEKLDLTAIDMLGWEVEGMMDRAPKREMMLDGQLLRSPKMEERRAEALNTWFRDAPDWALGGIVLIAFGKRWHPVGLESFITALDSKDSYLNAYAIEGLLATDEEMLPSLMSKDLVDVLIGKSLKNKHDHFTDRVITLLHRGLPQAQVTKASGWKRWWRLNEESYLPGEWNLPPLPLGAEESQDSVAQGFVERAFDLYAAGMELVIVIDATGSMQNAIDASVGALEDFSAIMEGISPKFRMGLVEYRDHGDMKNGAKIVEPLSSKVDKIRKRLSRVTASGGGDYPEAVLSGLLAAFEKKMGWKRDTNKLLVVVGDAPPHQRTMEDLLDLVREANEAPFGEESNGRGKGGSDTHRGVRPFVTSAIGVGGGSVEATTRNRFVKIAEAGGGAYSEVLTAAGGGDSASVEIAEHILSLSFGSRWRNQMHDLVRIYMRYRDVGFFK